MPPRHAVLASRRTRVVPVLVGGGALLAALVVPGAAAADADTTPPAAPVITGPPAGTWLPGWGGSCGKITFQPSPDDDLKEYLVDVDDPTGAGTTMVVAPQQEVCVGFESMGVTTEGQHTVYMRAVDTAGNVSPAAAHAVLVDLTPTGTVQDLAVATPPGTTQFTVSWSPPTSGDAVTRYRLEFDYDWQNPVYTTGTSYTATLPVRSANPALGGSHEVLVAAEDAHGLSGGAARRYFALDPTPQTAPVLLGTSADGSWARTAALSFRYTPAGDPESGIDRHEVLVDGQVAQVLPGAQPGDTAQRTVASTPAWIMPPHQGFSDGTHTLRLRAYHPGTQGYPATTSAVVTYRVDRTAPTPARITAPGSRVWAGRTTVVWSAPADATSGVGALQVVVDGRATPVPATARRATVTLRPGRHSLAVVATDRAGNRSTSAALAVTAVARAVPSTPTISSPRSGTRTKRTFRLRWAASVPSYGATLTAYRVSVDGRLVATVRPTQRYRDLTVRAGAHRVTVVAVDSKRCTSATATTRITAR
jgi:hypothetical protein